MSYHRLTLEERSHIYELHVQNLSVSRIALLTGRDKSTISRELRRNRGQRGYRPAQAQRFAKERQANCANGPRVCPVVWQKAQEKILEDWSPEIISGRFEAEGIGRISHETISQRVYQDKRAGGSLHEHLRCQKKRRKRYRSGRSRRGQIPNRVGIEERPTIVDERTRIGDWEGDTIIGKGHKQAIVSVVERKSRYALLYKVENKTEAQVTEALITRLQEAGGSVKTITFDNGLEFCGHAKVAAGTGAKIYFATPYRSCERGLNEQTNGLVRQYFPKGSSFHPITQADVLRAERALNTRPRKVLDYKTPEEVFRRSVIGRAVALRV